MNTLIRKCPKCGSERSPSEMRCQNLVNDVVCGWTLLNEPLINPSVEEVIAVGDQAEIEPMVVEDVQANYDVGSTNRVCIEGHPVEDGDIICFVCGGEIIESRVDSEDNYIGQDIESWNIQEQIFLESDGAHGSRPLA